MFFAMRPSSPQSDAVQNRTGKEGESRSFTYWYSFSNEVLVCWF